MREEVKKNIDMFSKSFHQHGEAFVVSLLLFEKEMILNSKHISNKLIDVYKEVYDKYMDIDDMKLLNENFDYLIKDVKDNFIQKSKKEVER